MLNIEDVKVGDELVCIDRDGFNDSHRHNSTLTEFKVCKVGDLGVCINDGDWIIEIEELKHFKKKEQSQYAFDDLIDVAKKAVRDGVLQSFTFGRDLKDLDLISVVSIDNRKHIFNYQSTKSGIKHIQSLYKETFVIETVADALRVDYQRSVVLLQSGEKLVLKDHKSLNSMPASLFYRIFKGATVEQERGRDD